MAESKEDETVTPQAITELPIQSLRQLQQTVTEQYEYISRNMATLKMARNRFNGSKVILDSYTESNHKKETLLPLTDSLYVPGYLHTDKVMVDLGVGYFAERTPKEAQQYFERKVKFVQKRIDELSKKMEESANGKEQIENVLRQKIQEEVAKQQQIKNGDKEDNPLLAK